MPSTLTVIAFSYVSHSGAPMAFIYVPSFRRLFTSSHFCLLTKAFRQVLFFLSVMERDIKTFSCFTVLASLLKSIPATTTCFCSGEILDIGVISSVIGFSPIMIFPFAGSSLVFFLRLYPPLPPAP